MKNLTRQILEKLKSTTAIGLMLSGIGLTLFGFGLVDLIRSWLDNNFTATALAIRFLCAVAVGGVGFALMVLGADPFSETSGMTIDSELAEDNEQRRAG